MGQARQTEAAAATPAPGFPGNCHRTCPPHPFIVAVMSTVVRKLFVLFKNLFPGLTLGASPELERE